MNIVALRRNIIFLEFRAVEFIKQTIMHVNIHIQAVHVCDIHCVSVKNTPFAYN